MNKITWVKGNTLALSVPLVTKTATNGQWVTDDYVPPTGSEIKVRLVNSFKTRETDYSLSGNVVSFIDNGKLDVGSWGIEITVKEPTERNLRTFKCGEVLIVNCTDELGEVPTDGNIVLDAAYFIQGPQGIQGPAGTTDYNDLQNKPHIPSQLAEMTDDTAHRTVSDSEKQTWNQKLDKVTTTQFDEIFN